MMYASKMLINYKPQKVKYHREIELPERLLEIKDISKHLKEKELFSISERMEGFETKTFLEIFGYRLETQKELKTRIAKQEKYNENYEKFHIKYPKK